MRPSNADGDASIDDGSAYAALADDHGSLHDARRASATGAAHMGNQIRFSKGPTTIDVTPKDLSDTLGKLDRGDTDIAEISPTVVVHTLTAKWLCCLGGNPTGALAVTFGSAAKVKKNPDKAHSDKAPTYMIKYSEGGAFKASDYLTFAGTVELESKSVNVDLIYNLKTGKIQSVALNKENFPLPEGYDESVDRIAGERREAAAKRKADEASRQSAAAKAEADRKAADGAALMVGAAGDDSSAAASGGAAGDGVGAIARSSSPRAGAVVSSTGPSSGDGDDEDLLGLQSAAGDGAGAKATTPTTSPRAGAVVGSTRPSTDAGGGVDLLDLSPGTGPSTTT